MLQPWSLPWTCDLQAGHRGGGRQRQRQTMSGQRQRPDAPERSPVCPIKSRNAEQTQDREEDKSLRRHRDRRKTEDPVRLIPCAMWGLPTTPLLTHAAEHQGAPSRCCQWPQQPLCRFSDRLGREVDGEKKKKTQWGPEKRSREESQKKGEVTGWHGGSFCPRYSRLDPGRLQPTALTQSCQGLGP